MKRTLPISIGGVKVRRYIWPPEAVTHIRIEASRSVLLHTRNIGPFRQNLHVLSNKLTNIIAKIMNKNIQVQLSDELPSIAAHATQIHLEQEPLEQLLFQGIPHKQNPLVGRIYLSV